MANTPAMRRKNSAGSFIVVETEITVHTEDNGNNSNNNSRSQSHSSQPICLSRPGSRQRAIMAANDDRHLDVYRHPTAPRNDAFRNVLLYNTSENGFHEMMQLLKRTPPPSNYMSVPDSFSASEDDKWNKVKRRVLRQRRRPRKRRPPVIRLPDSAVAATTIGGHRHIAISIPVEYSHLAPIPTSQYPIYDSIEAAFQREVDSRFGVLRPSDRVVTVLNPVAEDRESLSSMSISPKASLHPERPAGTTGLSAPPRRPRPHSVSLLPSEEQYYGSRKGRDAAKRRSAASSRSAPQPPTALASTSRPVSAGPSTRGKHRMSAPPGTLTGESAKSQPPRSSLQEIRTSTASYPASDRPAITLTLPTRTSSKRARPSSAPPRASPDVSSRHTSSESGRGNSNNSGGNDTSNGSGHDHGGRLGAPRGSLAESLVTTASSPKLFKAQTATAYQSIPIVVHPSAAEVDSPLNLNFPRPPSSTRERVDRSIQTTPSDGLPSTGAPLEERPQSRKDRVREKKQRDMERLRAQTEKIPVGSDDLLPQVGKSSLQDPPESSMPPSHDVSPPPPSERPPAEPKLKGPDTTTFPMMPGIQTYLPKIFPSAILGKNHPPPASDSPASSTQRSSPPASPRFTWEHGSDRTSYQRRKERQAKREEREERRARYMAKLLAEERSSLDKLTREELLQRYEALRETRIYEMERRMSKLERNRDSWVLMVPMLLETLNRVVREQQHLLRDVRLGEFESVAAAGPSHSRSQRRRPYSAETSSASASASYPSQLSLDPLETRRAQNVPSGSESRSGRRPPKLDLAEYPSGVPSGLRGGQLKDTPRPKHSPLYEEPGEETRERQPTVAEEKSEDAVVVHDRARRKERLKTKLRLREASDEPDAGYFSTRSNDSLPDPTTALVPIVQGLQEISRLTSAMR